MIIVTLQSIFQCLNLLYEKKKGHYPTLLQTYIVIIAGGVNMCIDGFLFKAYYRISGGKVFLSGERT